jgi:hypothetical protein
VIILSEERGTHVDVRQDARSIGTSHEALRTAATFFGHREHQSSLRFGGPPVRYQSISPIRSIALLRLSWGVRVASLSGSKLGGDAGTGMDWYLTGGPPKRRDD